MPTIIDTFLAWVGFDAAFTVCLWFATAVIGGLSVEHVLTEGDE